MTSTFATDHQLGSPGEVARPVQGRGWVYAGVGAGLAGIAAVVASALAGAVYDAALAQDAPAIVAKMGEQVPQMLVMHVAAVTSALLLIVFAAGLRRLLSERSPAGSLVPQVAFSGLLLVSVTLLMGSALDTEFIFAATDPDLVVPEAAVFYGHWIGTVPWVWVGAGMSALALAVAGRRFAAVPAWLTWTSFVLGGLTAVLGASPLQYLAGMTGPLWLTITAVALVKKD